MQQKRSRDIEPVYTKNNRDKPEKEETTGVCPNNEKLFHPLMDLPKNNVGLSMQDMFMQYPIGSKFDHARVAGYRQMKNQSSLLLSNGTWKNL